MFRGLVVYLVSVLAGPAVRTVSLGRSMDETGLQAVRLHACQSATGNETPRNVCWREGPRGPPGNLVSEHAPVRYIGVPVNVSHRIFRREQRKLWFVAFADDCGVNIPDEVDLAHRPDVIECGAGHRRGGEHVVLQCISIFDARGQTSVRA